MIDDQGLPKIIDFDVSKDVKDLLIEKSTFTMTSIGGTLGYVPDEYFEKKKIIDFKFDIYSFGVSMAEVIGKLDVSEISLPSQLRERVKNMNFHSGGAHFKPFVEKLIAADRKQRPSASEASRDIFWNRTHFSSASLPGNWTKVLFLFF